MSKSLLEGLEREGGSRNIDDYIFGGELTEGLDECICGCKIKFRFLLTNKKTSVDVFPIGSKCILNFKDKNITADFNEWNNFKSLESNKILTGKFKDYTIGEAPVKYLKWVYENCNSNKQTFKKIKEYYELKYVRAIELKYMRNERFLKKK